MTQSITFETEDVLWSPVLKAKASELLSHRVLYLFEPDKQPYLHTHGISFMFEYLREGACLGVTTIYPVNKSDPTTISRDFSLGKICNDAQYDAT